MIALLVETRSPAGGARLGDPAGGAGERQHKLKKGYFFNFGMLMTTPPSFVTP